MAKPTGTMVDKMFPAGEDIELPGERKAKKKGGKGKWVVISGMALGIIGGGLAYNALSKKDVVPANYPAEPIVDTRPVPKPKISKAPKGREARLQALSRIKPGKYPLTDLAVIKDQTVYPNDVDKTLLGYKYDFKDPRQFALALVEGYNNRDERLLKKLHGGDDEGYWRLKPKGKLTGSIEDYRILDYNDKGSRLAFKLEANCVYQDKKFKRIITIFAERSEDGNIVAYSSSFG